MALPLVVLLVVPAACSSTEHRATPTVEPAAVGAVRRAPATPTTVPPVGRTPAPAPPTAVPVTPIVEPAAVQAVRRELAGRLGVAGSSLQLVSSQSVTWPDASLGCPQEGFAYAQVQTPGYRVVMEHNGQRYTYHTNATASLVVTC